MIFKDPNATKNCYYDATTGIFQVAYYNQTPDLGMPYVELPASYNLDDYQMDINTNQVIHTPQPKTTNPRG